MTRNSPAAIKYGITYSRAFNSVGLALALRRMSTKQIVSTNSGNRPDDDWYDVHINSSDKLETTINLMIKKRLRRLIEPSENKLSSLYQKSIGRDAPRMLSAIPGESYWYIQQPSAKGLMAISVENVSGKYLIFL